MGAIIKEVAALPRTRDRAPAMSRFEFIKGALYSPGDFDFGVSLSKMVELKEVVIRFVDRDTRLDWRVGRTEKELTALLVGELNSVFVALGLKDKPVACDFLFACAAEVYWAKQFTQVEDDPFVESHRVKSGSTEKEGDALPSKLMNSLDRPRGDCKDLGAAVCRTINAARELTRPDGKRFQGSAGPISAVVRSDRDPGKPEASRHVCVVLQLRDGSGRSATIPSDPYITTGNGPGEIGDVARLRSHWKLFPLTKEELNAFSYKYNGCCFFSIKLDGLPLATAWLSQQTETMRVKTLGGLKYEREVWFPLGEADREAKAMFEYLARNGPLL
ncbi:MAG: hypothetical protein KIS66_06275 [Fimbriimonadaceae bacterium]|nr:hypothetical protein [Fimbriimonadaceae bacterium]